MYQLLFEPEIKMPHSDFTLFVACNNAPASCGHKKDFYRLKERLLREYGQPCGYDLQVIEYKCWTCDGTGVYKPSGRTCYNCHQGVYEKRHVCLERFELNGRLFHIPVGRVYPHTHKLVGVVDCPGFTFVSTIKGIVQHDAPEVAPGFAYMCLLYKYDKPGFDEALREFRNSFSKDDWRKWGAIANLSEDFFGALATWFKIKDNLDLSGYPDDVEESDDLPF